MVVVNEVWYLVIVGIVLLCLYRTEAHVTLFFAWLEDITMIGSEIISRLDRLTSILYDLTKSFHTDYDFISNKLFKTTLDAAKKEICNEVLENFKTKNGALKKKVADEIIKLAAQETTRRKTK